MPDDWRDRWRSWLHPDSYAHPNSPAGGSGTGFSRTPGSTGYSWSPLPDPNSPAGRFIHLQTEIWALEQRERDEIARHVEKLETSLAKQSDRFRESIPDGYLRTLYDRQVGRTKGTYDFAKSLISTGVDATLLLQRLTSPVGWLDPDLQGKLKQGYLFGIAVSKFYVKWEFGTLQEKKQVLKEVGALAERVYDEAKNSIQRQWAEAKRAGKQEELVERWKTRLILEIGTLAIGAGELKAAGSAAKGLEVTAEAERTLQVGENVTRASRGSQAFQDTLRAATGSGSPPVTLFSSNELEGVERASPELLRAIGERRQVQIVTEGSEEMRYLDTVGAEANVGGPNMDHILLRPNPSKAAVLEEFLHGTQHKLGLIDRLGPASAETHVKDFMISHQKLLGLSDEDVARLIQLRDKGL
jgi:hypothetical protein